MDSLNDAGLRRGQLLRDPSRHREVARDVRHADRRAAVAAHRWRTGGSPSWARSTTRSALHRLLRAGLGRLLRRLRARGVARHFRMPAGARLQPAAPGQGPPASPAVVRAGDGRARPVVASVERAVTQLEPRPAGQAGLPAGTRLHAGRVVVRPRSRAPTRLPPACWLRPRATRLAICMWHCCASRRAAPPNTVAMPARGIPGAITMMTTRTKMTEDGFRVAEVFERSLTLSHWSRPDGAAVSLGVMPFTDRRGLPGRCAGRHGPGRAALRRGHRQRRGLVRAQLPACGLGAVAAGAKASTAGPRRFRSLVAHAGQPGGARGSTRAPSQTARLGARPMPWPRRCSPAGPCERQATSWKGAAPKQ